MTAPTETAKQAARRLAAPVLAKGYEAEALHEYRDPSGRPLFWRIRAKHPQTCDKWIRPMYVNGHRFELGEPASPGLKPLYRLDEISKAPDRAEVIVVEGEKAADALAALGVLVTTSGGADSADRADWTPLGRLNPIIWPDLDEAGKRYGEAVSHQLQALNVEAKWIEVASLGLSPKGDAFDWIAMHESASATDALALPRVAAVSVAPSLALRGAQNALGATSPAPTVELIAGESVRPEPISWLWKGYLARGKLHVLAGAPGTGKTMIALALAATVSRGGRWPDGTRCEPGYVLIWSGEDDIADTLAPRLLAMDADMTRIRFVGATRTAQGHAPFDPATDMPALAAAAEAIGNIDLLIVDPVVSAVAGDSHKNAEVRRGLQPLVDAGHSMGAAVLGISHFSKGSAGRDPVERVTGSLAFGALARVVMAAAKRADEDGGGRILARAKSNIGPDGGGFAYDLAPGSVGGASEISVHVLRWGAALEGSAKELLADADASDSEERGAIAEASEFLEGLLADGPVPARAIKKDCEGAGIAWRTMQEASRRLGIEKVKVGMREGWTWALPKMQADPKMHEGAKPKPLHLRAPSADLAPSEARQSGPAAETATPEGGAVEVTI